MKHLKRSNLYVNYNKRGVYNPVTGLGTSFGWYALTRRIDGVVFFNTNTYSSCTAKHSWKMRDVMDKLGVKIDVFAWYEEGIPDSATLADAFVAAEEAECDYFLVLEERKITRNERARERRARMKAQATPALTPRLVLHFVQDNE